MTTERSEADVLDQRRELGEPDEPTATVAPALIPEVDPADLDEQARAVVLGGEDA